MGNFLSFSGKDELVFDLSFIGLPDTSLEVGEDGVCLMRVTADSAMCVFVDFPSLPDRVEGNYTFGDSEDPDWITVTAEQYDIIRDAILNPPVLE